MLYVMCLYVYFSVDNVRVHVYVHFKCVCVSDVAMVLAYFPSAWSLSYLSQACRSAGGILEVGMSDCLEYIPACC